MLFGRDKVTIPETADALPGRAEPITTPGVHAVLDTPFGGPYPDGYQTAIFALGCFWGAEQTFWQTPGVWTTAVGYTGGVTPNPTYEETCTGRTGHTEAVLVVFDPSEVTYAQLLKVFWEHHDPTQGMRQGNDIGSQYRSGIYATDDAQLVIAKASREQFAPRLRDAGYGDITTEIVPAGEFYFAESYHQQYLYKVPGGYCPVHATGVSCPVGVATVD
jgi:peptide-methionine (S)-S-oxide reductase